MGKITARLIKYYILIISSVILICFIASSIFLSIIYTNMQYSSLKASAEALHSSLKTGSSISEVQSNYDFSSAVLIKDGSVSFLTSSKMGMMQFIRNIDFNNISVKGKIKNPMNEEFIYYKYSTDMGDILVLKSDKFSTAFLNTTYVILLLIFFAAVIISIPIVLYIGKRLTNPILKLQKAALDISHGHFDIDVNINTKDEIEDLSKSIKFMSDTLAKKAAIQRDFIANVSHDFRTPLSIIRNYSEAIYDDILSEPDKKSYQKEIIKEVDRLNTLVIDILQLSKLQGGTNVLQKEYFNLSEFLISFDETFKLLCTKKGLNISITSPEIEVLADAKYLHRVVYNFIDNAIKFSHENTTIDISAYFISEGVKVSVMNNGTGIDESMLKDIWERYYKNNESGGMGLGLAICSEILKMHKFEYGVNSNLDSETEFYFIVPNNSVKTK